ncbi:MAG: alpha/beta hydrolase [Myxococcota bacterium]|nr:alpha/beta hydrolase [Myxococcota bacterium]
MKTITFENLCAILVLAMVFFFTGQHDARADSNFPSLLAPKPSELADTVADQRGPYLPVVYRSHYGDVYAPTVRIDGGPLELPYPIALVAGDLIGNKESYEWIGYHLASHGWVVGIPPTGLTATLLARIDQLLSQMTDNDSYVNDIANFVSISIVGHGIGGSGALQLTSQTPDIKAIIALGPGDELEEDQIESIDIPVLLIHGDQDCVYDIENTEDYFYWLNTSNREMLTFVGGNHYGFNDGLFSIPLILGGIFGDCQNETVGGLKNQLKLARRYITSWLEYYVKGRNNFLPYLSGGDILENDIQDGWVISQEDTDDNEDTDDDTDDNEDTDGDSDNDEDPDGDSEGDNNDVDTSDPSYNSGCQMSGALSGKTFINATLINLLLAIL